MLKTQNDSHNLFGAEKAKHERYIYEKCETQTQTSIPSRTYSRKNLSVYYQPNESFRYNKKIWHKSEKKKHKQKSRLH